MKVLGEANVWEMHVSSLLQAALPGTICVRACVCVWNRRVVALAGRAAGYNMCARVF